MVISRQALPKLILLLIALIGAAVWFFCLRQTEEDKIRRMLHQICESVSYTQQDGNTRFARIGKAKFLMKNVAPQVHFQVEVLNIDDTFSSELLVQRYYVDQNRGGRGIQVSITDPTIAVAEDGTGKAAFTATVKLSSDQGEAIEVRDCDTFLKKNEEGAWVVTGISIRKVIEP